MLVGVSELVDWGRRMQGKGLSAPPPGLAWSEMLRFKRTFVEDVPAAIDHSFAQAGIRAVHGRARFVGPRSLRVGDETHVGEHVVIAAGSRHAALGIAGEQHLTTSTGFLGLDDLPARVVFVGGGYIAFEFAHVAARAGAIVSVLHRGERPLEGFDADLVAALVEITRELGVDVQVGMSVVAIEKRGDEFVVQARAGDETIEVVADLVVHAAGRVPEVDDLDLEAAGVARADNGGVAVNEFLRA